MIKQGSRVKDLLKVHFYGAFNIKICLVIIKICLLETLFDELYGITVNAFIILVSRCFTGKLAVIKPSAC